MVNPDSHGIYEDATLGSGDHAVDLTTAYYWARTVDNQHLVDIPHEEIPPVSELTGYDLTVRDSEGAVVVEGEIESVGQEDGLGGATTVILTQVTTDEG